MEVEAGILRVLAARQRASPDDDPVEMADDLSLFRFAEAGPWRDPSPSREVGAHRLADGMSPSELAEVVRPVGEVAFC